MTPAHGSCFLTTGCYWLRGAAAGSPHWIRSGRRPANACTQAFLALGAALGSGVGGPAFLQPALGVLLSPPVQLTFIIAWRGVRQTLASELAGGCGHVPGLCGPAGKGIAWPYSGRP